MSGMGGGMPGMAGMPGLNEILSDPEVLAAIQDPEVMVAFQDVAQNPGNTSKYQSNSKEEQFTFHFTTKSQMAVMGQGTAVQKGDLYALTPHRAAELLVTAKGETVVTGYATDILRALELEHPAARLLRLLAQSQAEQSGDGAAFVVPLAQALLAQAERPLRAGLPRAQLREA
eukprot:bmy_11798T0